MSLTLRPALELQLQQQRSPQEEAAEWEQHLKIWLELMLGTRYLLETPGKKARKLLLVVHHTGVLSTNKEHLKCVSYLCWRPRNERVEEIVKSFCL